MYVALVHGFRRWGTDLRDKGDILDDNDLANVSGRGGFRPVQVRFRRFGEQRFDVRDGDDIGRFVALLDGFVENDNVVGSRLLRHDLRGARGFVVVVIVVIVIFFEVAVVLIVVIARIRSSLCRKSSSQVLLSSSLVEHYRWVSLSALDRLRITAREASRGTRFATYPLMKSAFGSPTRPGLDPRLEKTQNLVSTNVPEVIESLRASCNGNGIVMVRITMSTMGEPSEALDEFK